MSFLTLIRQGSEQVSRLCRKSTDNIEDAFDNVTNLVAFGMGASVKRCLFLRRAKYIECEFFGWECEFVVGSIRFVENLWKFVKPCPLQKKSINPLTNPRLCASDAGGVREHPPRTRVRPSTSYPPT